MKEKNTNNLQKELHLKNVFFLYKCILSHQVTINTRRKQGNVWN